MILGISIARIEAYTLIGLSVLLDIMFNQLVTFIIISFTFAFNTNEYYIYINVVHINKATLRDYDLLALFTFIISS